jgi:hypothetical protein
MERYYGVEQKCPSLFTVKSYLSECSLIFYVSSTNLLKTEKKDKGYPQRANSGTLGERKYIPPLS